MDLTNLALTIALTAKAALHPEDAALVRLWAMSMEEDGKCGPAAIKASSPGAGLGDWEAIVMVEDAAGRLGLVPGRGKKGGFIRLPSSIRSRGIVGARKRLYMRRWTTADTIQ